MPVQGPPGRLISLKNLKPVDLPVPGQSTGPAYLSAAELTRLLALCKAQWPATWPLSGPRLSLAPLTRRLAHGLANGHGLQAASRIRRTRLKSGDCQWDCSLRRAHVPSPAAGRGVGCRRGNVHEVTACGLLSSPSGCQGPVRFEVTEARCHTAVSLPTSLHSNLH